MNKKILLTLFLSGLSLPVISLAAGSGVLQGECVQNLNCKAQSAGVWGGYKFDLAQANCTNADNKNKVDLNTSLSTTGFNGDIPNADVKFQFDAAYYNPGTGIYCTYQQINPDGSVNDDGFAIQTSTIAPQYGWTNNTSWPGGICSAGLGSCKYTFISPTCNEIKNLMQLFPFLSKYYSQDCTI